MYSNLPSMTAYRVALNIVALGGKSGMDRILPPGIVEATKKLLVASGTTEAATLKWAESRQMISVYEAFDWMLPGQFEALAHRKAFCERQVREGILDGATQILILGAGYDTLGWRLAPEFLGVNFFEIDHPATAALKAKGINALGRTNNLFLIPEDLAKKKLANALSPIEHWDHCAQTVIVAEGLVMYLSSEAVRDLFCQCARMTGLGSRMVFSYIPAGADDRPDIGPWTGLVLWLLVVGGEPWIWSIQPDKLGLFLEKTGWAMGPALAETADKHGVELYVVAKRKPVH